MLIWLGVSLEVLLNVTVGVRAKDVSGVLDFVSPVVFRVPQALLKRGLSFPAIPCYYTEALSRGCCGVREGKLFYCHMIFY